MDDHPAQRVAGSRCRRIRGAAQARAGGPLVESTREETRGKPGLGSRGVYFQ